MVPDGNKISHLLQLLGGSKLTAVHAHHEQLKHKPMFSTTKGYRSLWGKIGYTV